MVNEKVKRAFDVQHLGANSCLQRENTRLHYQPAVTNFKSSSNIKRLLSRIRENDRRFLFPQAFRLQMKKRAKEEIKKI